MVTQHWLNYFNYMAKSITRWEPDTHPGVIIDLEVDSNNPTAEPVFKRFGHKDDIYSTAGGDPVLAKAGGAPSKPIDNRFLSIPDSEVYSKLIGENRTKNIAIEEVIKLLPAEDKKTIIDSKGGERVVPINEIKYTIKPDGVVEIDIGAVSLGAKTIIQTDIKTQGVSFK